MPTIEEIKNEEEQIKEFLSRVEIKTMRKDLQKLREKEALRQREKIIKMKTPLEEAEKTETRTEIAPEIFLKKTEEEKEAVKQLKNYAIEEEKQRIFYLEAEKLNLEKQLQVLQKEKESSLLLEKNNLLLERKDIEKELKTLSGEEKRIEDEQKFISESEKTANVPSDKMKLEKKRGEIDEHREETEKKRWAIEKELEKKEVQLKEVETKYQDVLTEENGLKNKIEEINGNLKIIYTQIMEREEGRKELEKKEKTAEELQLAEKESERKEEIRRHEWTKTDKIEDETFLKDLPEKTKERLIERIEGGLVKEVKERKKFLEGVEEWAKEEKTEEKPQTPVVKPKEADLSDLNFKF